MPFYEFQCAKCGHVEEVLQKISDEPLKKCPACGKSAMQKMVSAAAFRLKGSGWYETDFKSGPKKNLDSKNAAGDTKGDNAAGKKSTDAKKNTDKKISGDSTKRKKDK